MATLAHMPPIIATAAALTPWGAKWTATPNAFTKKDGMDFGKELNKLVGSAVATMLGGIPIITPNRNHLMPANSDAVEVGDVRVIGGIRPQNFDVGYRPDGVRFAFDGKTLNDTGSVKANYQNMVNDLGTEATSVHARFPFAVVAFIIAIPCPCFIAGGVRERYTRLLDRLAGRMTPADEIYKAEAMSLVLWDPAAGGVDPTWPDPSSLLRIEKFSDQVEKAYETRYGGLPPHD